MSIQKPFSAVILCAGQSSRMGLPKAFLQFSETKTFLEQIIDVYTDAGAERIVIVCNRELHTPISHAISANGDTGNCSVVMNTRNSTSRFSSIKTGIENVKQGHFVFIQNIDNPFTESESIKQLADSALTHCYAVPVINGRRAHPVILAPEIVRTISEYGSDDIDFREFLSAFHRIEVPLESVRLTANINTPFDYGNWFGQTI